MAFRIRVEGKTVECDRAEEAVELLNAIRPSVSVVASPNIDGPVDRPLFKTSPMSARKEHRASNSVRDFLSVLKESYPTPLTSENLAERLQMSAKGLPAVVMGVRVLFGKWGVKFEDVVLYAKRADGDSTVSTYCLTSQGIAVLQEQASEKET